MRLLQSIFFRALKERRFKYRYFSIKKSNSYVSKNGSLPFSDVTVADLLDNASDTYGGHTALISAHQNIAKNYWELRNEAEKLASGFIACGLQKGDKIAIYSPNCYEWSLTQLAAAKSGLILVAINYSCTPQELEYCLKKVSCKAVVSFNKLEHQDFYETFNKIIPNLRANKAGRIQSDKFPSLEKVIMMSDENKEGTIRFKDVLESRNRESDIALSQIKKTIQFDDPSHILFTSGTTGYPKAAILNNQKALNNLIRIFYRLGFDKMEPVICCPVPFFHIFGCHIGTLGMILSKSTTILPSATYNYVKNLNCIEKYKCNVMYGTPTMLVDLLRRSRELQMDISTINTIATGASPIPESLMKDLYSSFKQPNIHVMYGLTECGAIAQMGSDIDCETAMKGFLEPCEQTELKIIDNKGFVVPKNVKGEICSRGYTTFLGYFDDKNKTAKSVDKNNWFHTGDIGIMNNKGWVKIVGRIKDMVIRGGENIFLTEVENFLSTHPAVLQVNICGVPDERLGEELCCWIVLKPNMSLTDEDVREYCKGKISHYKIPRYVMFVEDFPKTTTGKIKKHEMTEISKTKLSL
ncbi:medium-chain acyl-CoA ligase ACSF2, mitochondrial-like isoform X1 [Parasteatoda tepidariorum]|uniref:medium-chain acyl-CoA ligase ACSF2, mitochondrial-like isoform X1 n=1 Tax=Parasteatoda tepidariorum TaxID=114398 RepID=UPI001C72671B|nr:medium-chain acyl-CoA ligase ACSF2, mitochondrial-like isoform X2 [Parasteatoda tepidariorum]